MGSRVGGKAPKLQASDLGRFHPAAVGNAEYWALCLVNMAYWVGAWLFKGAKPRGTERTGWRPRCVN